MSTQDIPDVGTAPSPAPCTADPDNFDERADELLSWLPGWVNVRLPAILTWMRGGLVDAARSRDAAAASLASMTELAKNTGVSNAAAQASAAASAAQAKAGADAAQRAADAVAASAVVGTTAAAYLSVTLRALCDTNRLLLTQNYLK